MTKIIKPKAKRTAAAKAKSKSEHILSLLSRPSGVSISEIMKSTGWQAHSVRGFLSGSLKKKGQAVSSQLDGDGIRRYRLVARAEA